MVVTLHLVLLICALICMLSAAFSWPASRANMFYLSLAFLIATLII